MKDEFNIAALRQMAALYEEAGQKGLAVLLYHVAQLIELRSNLRRSVEHATDEAVNEIAARATQL